MDIDYVDILVGAVITLLVAEGCAWLPKLTRRIIRFAAARLSSDLRSRLEEEWLRHVSDLPGTFGPFLVACNCLLASLRISPLRLSLTLSEHAMQPFRLFRALVKSFLPKRAQLTGNNARDVTLGVRLAWIAAIAIGVALAAGALVSSVEALQRIASGDPSPASVPPAAHRKLPSNTRLPTDTANGGREAVRANDGKAEQVFQMIGEGEASYYGRELAGKRTASGERFDPDALTAAHRRLPMGTRLRVTNIANGKSVVVRVNDRGPFVRSRIMDVSLEAARQIRIVGA